MNMDKLLCVFLPSIVLTVFWMSNSLIPRCLCRHFTITHIWSNIMRTHIGLKICHFLQPVVIITEGPENKIMRKSCIHSSVPCQDSTLEQFLYSWVSKKNWEKLCFLRPLFYGWSIVLIDELCYSCGSRRYPFLLFF